VLRLITDGEGVVGVVGSGTVAQVTVGEGKGVTGLGRTSMVLVAVLLFGSDMLLLAWDKSASTCRTLKKEFNIWFRKELRSYRTIFLRRRTRFSLVAALSLK